MLIVTVRSGVLLLTKWEPMPLSYRYCLIWIHPKRFSLLQLPVQSHMEIMRRPFIYPLLTYALGQHIQFIASCLSCLYNSSSLPAASSASINVLYCFTACSFTTLLREEKSNARDIIKWMGILTPLPFGKILDQEIENLYILTPFMFLISWMSSP